MAFLVTRYKSADGDYNPDYDGEQRVDGIITYEKVPSKAVRTYARRIMGGEDSIQEGDVFELSEVSEDVQTFRVSSRNLNIKVTKVEDE
jgi:hypothetical protein